VNWLLAFVIILFESSIPGASKPNVVIDGDSITVLATPALHKTLDPSYDVRILAVIGIRIYQSLPALESELRLHPYAVVENLGTNDALQGGTHPNWVSGWDKLIRVTRTTPCVVLTTINPAADALSNRPIATRINADIRTLAARDPKKYKVADWSAFLSRHRKSLRSYLRAEPVLIHPTPEGSRELALLDRQALAKCASRVA
jgi:GDSL-like lipase/acylhydrolase family protein